MRSFLIVALALLVGCAAPATQPRYAAPDLDAAAKRFEPSPGKARVYATTSLWRSYSLIGCINQRFPIAASVYVNGNHAGDLTNIDNFVYIDVDPGDVDVYFNERGSASSRLAGAQARIRAERGGVYFFRVNGGNGPGSTFGVIGILAEAAMTNPFAVEQLREVGRPHIMERRLVVP